MKRALFLSLVVVIFSAGAAARADSGAEAAQALAHGVQLRRDRHETEALAEFRRAFALDPTARARAQIGLAEQALGQWVEAEGDIAAALAAPDDPWIARNRTPLEEARAEVAQHLGTIEVTVSVHGAELRVNGASVGLLPHAPIRVVAGAVALEVSAPGRATLKRTVDVQAGARVHEELVFADERRAEPAPSASAVSPASALPRAEAPQTSEAGSSKRTWGWVLVGGAGVSLVTAVVANLIREGDVAKYNDDAQCPPGHRMEVCGGVRDAGNQAAVVAGVGYGAAAALAIAGGVLMLAAPKGAVRVGAWGAPGSGGATVGGGF